MSSNYKRTFDEVRMRPERHEQIRAALSSRFSEEKREEEVGALNNTPDGKSRMKRLSGAALIAAVLAVILTVSALAVGVAYLAGRQADIRKILGIEGKDIPDYIEYSQSDDAGTISDGEISVTVLSSLQDKQFMRYFIEVSPVTPEQADYYAYGWYVQREGKDFFGGLGRAYSGENAYDEDTQSLLLGLTVMIGNGIEPDETEPFTVTLFGGKKILVGDYYKPIEPDVKAEFVLSPGVEKIAAVSITFGEDIEFTNPQTGETGKILGVEVNSGSMSWLLSYDGAERFFSATTTEDRAKYMQETMDWLNAFGNTIAGAALNMSDGSTKGQLNPEQHDFEDGIIKGNTWFTFPIELSAVESITVNGETYLVD